jgi:hypothetical protein
LSPSITSGMWVKKGGGFSSSPFLRGIEGDLLEILTAVNNS